MGEERQGEGKAQGENGKMRYKYDRRRNLLFPFSEQKSHSSTLKMEVMGSFATLVPSYQITQHHIPEECNVHIHHHENLESHIYTL
jgi:hypothetical protein